MPDPQNQAPPPPPGFSPVQDAASAPPPPPGFSPVQSANQPQVTNTAGETMPADVAARHARSREGHTYGPSTFDQAITAMDTVTPGIKTGVDIASGFAKEAAKTGIGAARLIAGDQAASTVAPEDLETKGAAETVGGIVEQGGEWAMGDAALEGGLKLLKVAKNAPHLIELIENYPKAAKILMGGAKGAAVGAAQGAVKESAPGGEGAAAGAKGGAEGGAAGGALAETVGMVAKPILNKMGLATSAEEDIARAAQPGKRNTNFIADWQKAAPRLVKEIEEGGKFTDMDDAANRIRDVRQGIWNDEVKPAIEKHAKEVVDTTPVANAVRELSEKTALKKNFPEDAKKLADFANKYTSGSPLFDGDRSVADLEEEIELYNGKLTDKGFWKKSASEKAAMIKANPEIAAWKTASDAMRDTLYDHLENVSGVKGMKDLKQTYGAVANVENEIRGQVNVASRQRPLSMKQIIGLTAGIVHGGPAGWAAAALPVIDKLYNSPEALLNRAVSKSAPAGPVKQVVQKATNAVTKNAANIGGFTGEQGVLMLGPNGPVMMHPEDVDKAKQMGYKPVESAPDNK